MESTRSRMILVATLVCFFAVGMAALLNYYKYRGTADRIVKERLLVVGNSIESGIQASLALGLQFGDLESLPGTMERERATDNLILGIEVFDTEGKALYSTDRLRLNRPVPPSWMAAAHRAGDADWFVEAESESAAGMAIKNNFGLTLGYVAVRFSDDRVRAAHDVVRRDLAVSALGIFVVAAALASLALILVKRRLTTEMAIVEASLRSPEAVRPNDAAFKGPFGRPLRRFFDTVRHADAQLAGLRAGLQRGIER
jgi:hypothetical protein